MQDAVYKTKKEKYKAVVEATKAAHAKGQPVLVGTITIEISELISSMLSKEGISHNVLNAKNHEQEAQIVAEAGKQGAFTTVGGGDSVAAVKQMIDRHSKRNDAYRKVFAALGFNRLPNPSDREIMDKWFDEMGCSLADVLDACKAAGGMREPHLRYVNKVIENRILEKGGVNTRAADQRQTGAPSPAGAPQTEETAKVSRKVLRDYYEHIRNEEERRYKTRIAEVTGAVPAIKDLFSAETQLNSMVITMNPGPDAREKRAQLKEKRYEIEEEKKALLRQNGYPEDYLRRKYRCNICRDTGYTDEGKVCTCAKERAEEAYKWIQKRNQ